MLLAHELIGDDSLPAVVLIHGITESRRSWHPLLHPLAAAHQVLAVDLRGHGESDDDDGYDPAGYAADVIETVNALEVQNPLIVGHSLGGIVATAYAALAPCRGVVNIDQPLQLSAFKDSLAMIEPMLRGDDQEFQQAIDLTFQLMSGPLSADEQARLAMHRRAERHVVMGTWKTVFESSVEELDAIAAQLAQAVKVPYLALHGMDPGPAYADWLYRLIPTATVEVWNDCGHYPHLVHPDRFIARLAEFEASIG